MSLIAAVDLLGLDVALKLLFSYRSPAIEVLHSGVGLSSECIGLDCAAGLKRAMYRLGQQIGKLLVGKREFAGHQRRNQKKPIKMALT
jgi:hypothetical protein